MKNKNLKVFSRILSFVLVFSFVLLPSRGDAATFLTSELQIGHRNAQVTALQQFLAEDPTIYPQGLVTGYFGPLTKAAVVRFQARYGISQVGRVGPITLAKINSLGSLLGGGGASVGSGLTTAPVMSSVAVVRAGNTTTLYWTTNESARSKLFFSNMPLATVEALSDFTEPAISGQVVVNPNFSLNHVFVLNTVTTTPTSTPSAAVPPNTTLYFRAMSIDQNNNVTVSEQGTFSTN